MQARELGAFARYGRARRRVRALWRLATWHECWRQARRICVVQLAPQRALLPPCQGGLSVAAGVACDFTGSRVRT